MYICNVHTRLFFTHFRTCRCLSTVSDIYRQLKQLNEKKKFHDALDLFNQHVVRQPPTSLTINQALRACVELNDLAAGTMIHNRFSSQSLNNSFIHTNLIRLYSKSPDTYLECHFILQLSSEMRRCEQSSRDLFKVCEENNNDVQYSAQW